MPTSQDWDSFAPKDCVTVEAHDSPEDFFTVKPSARSTRRAIAARNATHQVEGFYRF